VLDSRKSAIDDLALYLMLAAAVPNARAAPERLPRRLGRGAVMSEQIMAELRDVGIDVGVRSSI